jgi:hypothetical protein
MLEAARYSACCKARTGSITDPEAAELAETALTGLGVVNRSMQQGVRRLG